jgi:hypothetical protein
MAAAMGFAAGDRVGAYEILAPLGAGGMGERLAAHASLALSRDERWLYYSVEHEDADVWLLELK